MAERTTMNISLPESLRAWVDEQVEKGGYGSASEYVRHLLREERKRVTQEKLEEILMEGINSPSVTMTDADWEALKARVHERAMKKRRKKTG
jgi:antitoxin ParD1/3/4